MSPLTPRPPHQPPMTLKQVSWPHWALKITSPAFQIIRNPMKCHCWSCRTSYPFHLTPWDLVGLPPHSLGPSRPTPWAPGTFSNAHLTSRTYLVPVWSCFQYWVTSGVKKIQVCFESSRSVKINNFVLLGTLITLGFPDVKDISGYLDVKWSIFHILWNLSYFLWVLCARNSSLPKILGNTWYRGIPVTRGFSKPSRVRSGIKENVE